MKYVLPCVNSTQFGDYFPSYWENFDRHYTPDWRLQRNLSVKYEPDDSSWEKYCNKVLDGTGQLHWAKLGAKDTYIEFSSEEDMLNFIMKWS